MFLYNYMFIIILFLRASFSIFIIKKNKYKNGLSCGGVLKYNCVISKLAHLGHLLISLNYFPI